MLYNITLSLEAEDDILNAYLWYEQQRPGLGKEFTDALEHSFLSIQSNPETYGFRKKNVRGHLVKRFPYLILFLIEGIDVRVISIFHTHRRPAM